MTEPSPASAAAGALWDALIEQGLTDVVLAPGSRSQALALAASVRADAGRLRLHVRIDERVAGFTALGIGREPGALAAVVCTSGTAVANLHPAVLEAHHSAVPLLVLSADRPAELRGIGANQTTHQPGMFGAAVRWEADVPAPETAEPDRALWEQLACDAVAYATGGIRGPVHLNLAYREPLSGPDAPLSPRPTRGCPEPSPTTFTTLSRGPRTVVVAGADAGSDAEALAHDGGWPLIAEIVSGARFGRELVHDYRAALGDPQLGGRIERVAVLGHPTLSREVIALLSRPEVEIIAVHRFGEPLNLNGATRPAEALAVADGEIDRAWLGEWMRHSRSRRADLDAPAPDLAGLTSTDPRRRSGAVRTELAAVRRPVDRTELVTAVWQATWPHDRLVFGSSRLVRVADAVLPGRKVVVHANRGLAGIDGTIATAAGVAIVHQSRAQFGVTRVLLGDLALLHDVGSLLLPADEPSLRLQVIVGNDGGGTIFDTLEVAQTADPQRFDRVQYTPQSVDLAALATAYGWQHSRVTGRGELDQALTAPVVAPTIIEVPLGR